MARPRAVAAVKISSSSLFTQQLRQLGDVRRDLPRLVARQQPGRDVRFTPKADIVERDRDVRFVSKADISHLFDHLVGASQHGAWNR